jgi:hypothetical protein
LHTARPAHARLYLQYYSCDWRTQVELSGDLGPHLNLANPLEFCMNIVQNLWIYNRSAPS